MIIQDLHSSLQYGMLQGRLPWMILLQLGGNNIDNTNAWKIVCKAKTNIKYIFRNFPGSLLVWTDILPRLYWRNTDNTIQSLKAMDLKRKKVNRMIKSIVLKHPNGRVIIHGNIDRHTLGFFDHDGVHLSAVGYHMYLFTLSEALSAFIHHDDMKVFRMDS